MYVEFSSSSFFLKHTLAPGSYLTALVNEVLCHKTGVSHHSALPARLGHGLESQSLACLVKLPVVLQTPT